MRPFNKKKVMATRGLPETAPVKDWRRGWPGTRDSHPRSHPSLRSALLLVAGVTTVAIAGWHQQSGTSLADTAETEMTTDLALAEPVTQDMSEEVVDSPRNMASGQIDRPAPPNNTRTYTLRRGDSVLALLQKSGISTDQREAILLAAGQELKRVLPRRQLTVETTTSGDLVQLTYMADALSGWQLRQGDSGFMFSDIRHEAEIRTRQAVGNIQQSLFLDGQAAGLTDRQIMNLAEIFAWDIDFAQDLRPGDQFALIYEEQWLEDRKLGNGEILAAEFINQGKPYRAIGHRDNQGKLRYFTPDGESLQRAFLRSPVKFSRISSRFTKSRYHPVLKRWRAHKGVDYAAATGTPVRSTANGRVEFRGRKGGYGNTVIIRHGGTYSTLYAHLSGFARAARPGSRIKQGQVIGYVGKTGLASGPHLHYEFRVNSQHRNPLGYRFPKAGAIASQYKPEFEALARDMTARLDALSRPTEVAQANTPR